MFEFRYSGMLTILAVTLLYSGGLPIMYPTGAVFFFITYWMDKCLLFKCYRKPIKFDIYMARHTLFYFKFILLAHIGGFLLMYGYTPILQNHLFEFLPVSLDVFKTKETELSLFPFYFWLIAGLLALYIVWIVVIRSLIKIGRYCCGKKQFEKLEYGFGEDFYTCVSYRTLKHELHMTTKTIRNCRLMLETGNHN